MLAYFMKGKLITAKWADSCHDIKSEWNVHLARKWSPLMWTWRTRIIFIQFIWLSWNVFLLLLFLFMLKQFIVLSREVPIFRDIILLFWQHIFWGEYQYFEAENHLNFRCLCEEFYGCQLFRPMVFLQIVGIYADGILSMLGVHPFIQLYGMFLAVQVNAAILTHITFYRMKIIIPMSFRYYTHVIRFGIFSTVFMYVGAVCSVNFILLTMEDQMEAKNFIYVVSEVKSLKRETTMSTWLEYLQNIRPIPSVFWSEKYMVSSPKNPNIPTFLMAGTFCIGFYILLCILLPSICFIILHKTRHSLSEKVIKAQRAYLRTILYQVGWVTLLRIWRSILFFEKKSSDCHFHNFSGCCGCHLYHHAIHCFLRGSG